MAYAAVVSLVQTLEQLWQSDQLSVHYPSPQIQSLHENASSLQSSLANISRVPKKYGNDVNDLEIKIRNAIYKAQDTIEAFIYRQSETEEIPGDKTASTSIFLQELQDIIEKIGPIKKRTEEIANNIGHGKEDPQTGSSSSENALLSISASASKSKIVGQENDLKKLTGLLTAETPELQVVPITGMAGIGKTTLANSIYEDPLIERRFSARAWVTVSPDYHVEDIFLKLLGSMEFMSQNSDGSVSTRKLDDLVSQESDELLAVHLHKSLFNIRYIVVIDDMWDESVWDRVRQYLPDNKNGSRILLTTRNADIAAYAKSSDFHQMSPLDAANSWQLLCEKVFGGGACPLDHLETIGRDIAKNCGGLPLSITVVGGQLSQERKTTEYWESVAEDTKDALAKNEKAYLEILSLSFKHLPQKLKGCFLYMGAFPEDSEILVSKLIKLWVAEGFVTSLPDKSLEQVAEQYLKHLIDRNLVFIRKITSNRRIKSCGMHDSLRDLAVKESQREKFFHAIHRYVQEPSEDRDAQRRLSVHKNILMCMGDVYNSTRSIKLARTLLYAGPNHHHPLPFCLTFELLRVLDALTVYFIKFPIEIIKLIHLRYLSFTYNGKLPSKISKLRNLQILIVLRHPKIICLGASILPEEIWNMPQLRHLLFTESALPSIPSGALDSVLLQNLQSLSNVHASCCTQEVLQNIPNLKKLGIWIEKTSGAVPFYLDVLQELEVFKFTVLNPIRGSKIDFLPELVFPETLKRLCLSGCGIPWENMTVIAKLPKLEVLKLREFAFQGEEWCLDGMIFPELKFLLLESLDLIQWGSEYGDEYRFFPSLERLIIRHCYDLEEIPTDIGNIGGLELIELIDCSPSAVESAKEIRDKQKEYNKKDFQVQIYSSWE